MQSVYFAFCIQTSSNFVFTSSNDVSKIRGSSDKNGRRSGVIIGCKAKLHVLVHVVRIFFVGRKLQLFTFVY